MRTSTPNPTLTVRDVADMRHVGESTVRRWIREGRLRAYKVGPRAVRIDPRDLDRLNTQLAAPTYAHVSGDAA